jgi:hypothetical protein
MHYILGTRSIGPDPQSITEIMLKVALKHHVYSFMFVILKENALLNISFDITTNFSKTPLYAIKEKKLFNVRIKQIYVYTRYICTRVVSFIV